MIDSEFGRFWTLCVALQTSGLPDFWSSYFWPSVLLAFHTSGLLYFWSLDFWTFLLLTICSLYFWPSVLLVLWPSEILAFQTSGLLSFRTSVLPNFCPSGLLSFQTFVLPKFWTSRLLAFWPSFPMFQKCLDWDILDLLCILHQSQIPNVLPVFALSRSLPEWPWASLHCWPCPLHKHPSTARCHPWPTQRPLTFGVESVSLLFLGPC